MSSTFFARNDGMSRYSTSTTGRKMQRNVSELNTMGYQLTAESAARETRESTHRPIS